MFGPLMHTVKSLEAESIIPGHCTNLMFRDHISEKINKAYSILGIIKRNFIYMDEHTFISLYKSHVEFANSVWCPFKLGDIKEIEKIQKRATKLIIKDSASGRSAI